MAKDVKKILYREKKLAELSCKSGGFTEEFARERYGINERRMADLCHSGFFEEKVFNVEIEGKLERKYVYDLGDKGKEYVKDSGVCEVTQGVNGYRHTVAMQEVVYDLVNNQNVDIKDILNEKEQEVYFKDEIDDARCRGVDFRVNDIAIVTETEIRSIEIDTGYSSALKGQHRAYAEEVLHVQYETIFG